MTNITTIKQPKDIPKVLSHHVGKWMSDVDLNFVVILYLDDSLVDTFRDTGATNRVSVAQKLCIEALKQGIIEQVEHQFFIKNI